MRGRALLRDAIAIGVVLCAVASLGATAQDWPTRSMTIVVPFAPGGAADGTARVLAVGLSQVLGQNVIVENISGAGGTIGLPGLASAREQGLADFDVGIWIALAVAKAVPAPIVRKLHAATVAAMELPIVQSQTHKMGAQLVPPDQRSSEYLQKFLESEIAKWAKEIKASGMALD